jgi:hypothetical protein
VKPGLARLERAARGLAAVVSFLVLAVLAWLMLAWGPIGHAGPRNVLRALETWLVLLSLPVPLAAFPPLADRLVGRRVRWVFLLPTLAALLLCVGLTYDALARGFFDEHVLPIVIPTLPCALHLSWCVLLPPRAGRD